MENWVSSMRDVPCVNIGSLLKWTNWHRFCEDYFRVTLVLMEHQSRWEFHVPYERESLKRRDYKFQRIFRGENKVNFQMVLQREQLELYTTGFPRLLM